MTRPLTGRAVLYWVIGFFAVIIAINGIFIFYSITTFRGEDEQKPYLQEIAFNDTLARRAEQKRLGWTADITAHRLASGSIAVDVDLRGAQGGPQAGQMLRGMLRHPTDENRDRDLMLAEVAPGRYRTETRTIAPGRWDVIVANSDATTPFEARRRLWIP